jgi:hypothetical protein
MSNHLMIDLETFGTSRKALVLSLGAVVFDPYAALPIGKSLYFIIEPYKEGKIDYKAAVWWMNQDVVVRDIFLEKNATTSIKFALSELSKLFEDENIQYVWSHSSNFDIPILERLYEKYFSTSPWIYRQIRSTSPWTYRQIRDVRTLLEITNTKIESSKYKHNALDDAKNQALAVSKALNKISLKEDHHA